MRPPPHHDICTQDLFSCARHHHTCAQDPQILFNASHNKSRRRDPTTAPAVAIPPGCLRELPPWLLSQLPPWRRAANHSSRRGANHNSRRGTVRPTTASAETPKLQSGLGRETRNQARSLAALAHSLAVPNGDLQRLTPRLPQKGLTCKAIRSGVLLPMHLRRQTQTTVSHGRRTQMPAGPSRGPA